MENNLEKLNEVNHSERIFLAGPQPRASELIFTLKLLRDFIRGMRTFHFIGPCATVFGSARYKEGHPYYEQARQIGSSLVDLGFVVMTGGGPGLMEAANRGAREAGGKSVGCNIRLPDEQRINPYLDKWVLIDFFFVRKVLLTKYSYAFIVLPGGFGTLDELFGSVTLIQTKKSKVFPIIIMGKHFYKDLIEHIDHMIEEGTITKEEKDLILFTDDVNEAIVHIQNFAIKKFNLKEKKIPKPFWFFNERK